MANALYPKAKEAFLNGAINMSANTITLLSFISMVPDSIARV